MQAGLVQPTPYTARKRTTSSGGVGVAATPGSSLLIPSTPLPSAGLSSLKADLEASASAAALQRQVTSTARENSQLLRELGAIQERVRNLERERAILVAQQDKSLTRDTEKEAQDKEERRVLVASLGEFRDRCSALEEENEGLKHHNSTWRHEREMAMQEKVNMANQMEVLQSELAKVDEENQMLKEKQRQEQETAAERVQQLEKQLQDRPQRNGTDDHQASAQPQQDINVSEVLRKELHHQVQHLRTLEHSNSRLTREIQALKSERANVELLREEKTSLESKVRRLEGLRKKLAEVETECSALRREKDEWAAYLVSDSNRDGVNGQQEQQYSSPAQMAKSLASARIELLSLQEKLGASAAGLKSRDEVISELEGRMAELQDTTIPHYEREAQAAQDRMRALERTAGLDQKELQMLREQIETYATEEASMLAAAHKSDAETATEEVKPNLTAYDSQKSLKIRHLEELLEAHKLESSRNAKEAERLRGLLEARGDSTEVIDAAGETPPPGNAAKEAASRRTSFIVPGTPSRKGEAVQLRLTEQIKQNEELQEG